MDHKATFPAYKVKDLNLAEWGRKEILMAEKEMPGLMSLRAQYAGKHPLKGAQPDDDGVREVVVGRRHRAGDSGRANGREAARPGRPDGGADRR